MQKLEVHASFFFFSYFALFYNLFEDSLVDESERLTSQLSLVANPQCIYTEEDCPGGWQLTHPLTKGITGVFFKECHFFFLHISNSEMKNLNMIEVWGTGCQEGRATTWMIKKDFI